jgi:hypothetical protein
MVYLINDILGGKILRKWLLKEYVNCVVSENLFARAIFILVLSLLGLKKQVRDIFV